jgi:hypothetical protein
MKAAYFTLLLWLLGLLTACGNRDTLAESQQITSVPAGWVKLPNRHDFLPLYERYVNHHPGLSIPLQGVYRREGSPPATVFRGIVVGQRAQKASATVSGSTVKCVASSDAEKAIFRLTCEAGDSVRITQLFYDASPTETYLYATIDSTEQNGHNDLKLLNSFIPDLSATDEK